MIRTVLWLAAFLIFAILIIPVLLVSLLFWKKEPGDGASAPILFLINKLGPVMLRLAGAKVEYKGKENLPSDGRAVLFAGNHQGDFDIFVLINYLGCLPGIIAKKEALKVPVINLGMLQMNMIFMDRGNLRKSLECIKKAEQMLKAGRSVAVFPEGTRSRGPEMGEFKNGCFKCAINAGVDVVPFAIEGSYKLFEQQHYIKSAKMTISILPPVKTSEFANSKELSTHIQDLIQKELERIRSDAQQD